MMTRDQQNSEVIRQPVRSEPIRPIDVQRPPLDWGDEEPDSSWEDLYNRGLVSPPYQGRRNGQTVAAIVRSWDPLGSDITDEYLMCLLGRCDCCPQ